MQKLFIVYLGGKLGNGRVGEDHEVVMVVALDEKSARQQAMDKWNGVSKYGVHVDAICEMSEVDGYKIILDDGDAQSNENFGNKLF